MKARNLRENPRCVVCIEAAGEAVVVEGVAEQVQGRDALAEVSAAYQAKYQWTFDPEGDSNWVVRPTVAFGFIEQSDFDDTATRWIFE